MSKIIKTVLAERRDVFEDKVSTLLNDGYEIKGCGMKFGGADFPTWWAILESGNNGK